MLPLYLIAYDVAQPRRLGRIHRFLKARALPVQYSVFLARSSDEQREALLAGLRARMDARRDDVRLYRLPDPCHAQTLGRTVLPPGIFLSCHPTLLQLQATARQLPNATGELLATPPATPGSTIG